MDHPVDRHVGARVRERRNALGMTQQGLAERLGVTFQQVQKYELGVNRISASRLWSMGQGLGVPVMFFFEGLGDAMPCNDARNGPRLDREAQALLRSFVDIPEPRRRCLLDLARSLSKMDRVPSET